MFTKHSEKFNSYLKQKAFLLFGEDRKGYLLQYVITGERVERLIFHVHVQLVAIIIHVKFYCPYITMIH